MINYRPGVWFALVSPRGIALLPADVPADVVRTIWQQMAASDALGTVLGGLVGAFGASPDTLPPFAVVSVDADAGTARAVVRGEVAVTLRTRSGDPEAVSGEGVTTWTERHATDVVAVEVRADAATGQWLRARDGVVLAAAAEWVLDGGDPAPPPLPAAATPPPLPVVAAPPTSTAEHTLPPIDATFSPERDDDRVAEATTGYDDLLFGETSLLSVEKAAIRPPRADESTGTGASNVVGSIPRGPSSSRIAEVLGDHDGRTISAAQVAALQADPAGTPPPSAPTPPRAAPVVTTSTGERRVLDRGAVVGLRPSAVRATGIVPHLIAVASPNGEISRRHVELRVEGGDVLALDLDSTNGTRLLRVGAEPVRLQPKVSTLLVSGDRLDLGDGVLLSFEGLR